MVPSGSQRYDHGALLGPSRPCTEFGSWAETCQSSEMPCTRTSTTEMTPSTIAPDRKEKAAAPWLFVAGGMLGGFYVTLSTILTPRIGAAALMAFLVTGQLLAGMLIDRAGLLGVAVREISVGRVAGALLLLAGALMIRIY